MAAVLAMLAAPAAQPVARHEGAYVLATWKTLIDNGSLQDGDAALAATRRPAVAQLPRAAFDELAAAEGLAPFGLYHKALALALSGDLEGAEAVLSLPESEGMQRTRRSVLAQAEILGALGRADELFSDEANLAWLVDEAGDLVWTLRIEEAEPADDRP